MDDGRGKKGPRQLELPLSGPAPREEPTRPALRVISGGGQRQFEPLSTRDALVRVLIEAGADLLLRRISPERAGEIERRVNEALSLFDRVDTSPALLPKLRQRLEELEVLMRETRERRSTRRAK